MLFLVVCCHIQAQNTPLGLTAGRVTRLAATVSDEGRRENVSRREAVKFQRMRANEIKGERRKGRGGEGKRVERGRRVRGEQIREES